MAVVVNANQVRTNDGKVVSAANGGWYDGQQFWNGSLSSAGVINSQSNQQGAGQAVSKEVIAQTNPANVAYIQQQQQQPSSGGGVPSGGSYGAVGDGSGGVANGGAGIGIAPPAAINLPDIYARLNKEAGISDLEAKLQAQSQGFNDAQSKINDNPFLSESSRVGRVQKLQTDYNNNSKTLSDTIAMKKADVQTQLDLQTKQFDINSQSAKMAMDQFNSLLQSGALDGASGSDIANLTLSTGMTSGMIQSAIKAMKVKNTPTQVISFDDGNNQGFAVINPQTGEVISKQVIAGSKPSAIEDKAALGLAGGSGGGASSDIKKENAEAPQLLAEGAKQGKTLDDMISYGQSHKMTAAQVFNIYMAANYYHNTAAQIAAAKKKYKI